jgi:hypothetical protein
MYCKETLSLDFIAENISKGFFIAYEKVRSDMKFKAQRSLLPGDQPLVNNLLEIKKLKAEMAKLSSLILEKNYIIQKLILEAKENDKSKERKRQIREEKIRARGEKQTMEARIQDIKYHIIPDLKGLSHGAGAATTPRVVYERPCPKNDCRGFLSSAYKCGTCNGFFCADCHEEKTERNDDDHVCNEETKASISAIKLDSKPCPGPSCGSLIYKIDGCDHMWCVKCHTSFDWKTLKIIKSTNNPEYFRWLRESGQTIQRQDPNTNDCTAFPTVRQFIREITDVPNDLFYPQLQQLMHTIEVVLPRLPSNIDSLDATNLRVKYLMSEITEERWKKEFMKLSKKHEINFEKHQVLDMFCTCAKDIFMNFKQDRNIDVLIDQYEKLAEYGNRQLRKINDRYGSRDTQYKIRTFPRRNAEPVESI